LVQVAWSLVDRASSHLTKRIDLFFQLLAHWHQVSCQAVLEPLIDDPFTLTEGRLKRTIENMAQKVVITDDLDGSGDATTVSFSFEGRSFEIDLSKKNRGELERALKPYVTAARRAGGHRRRGRPISTGRKGRNGRANAPNPAVVREWAVKQRIPVSARGRISGDVLERYLSAH
jgi:hypothetical protein